MFFKPPRIRSKSHLAFVRKLPCIACGIDNMNDYFNDAAHIRIGCFAGISLKSGDDCTLPLCKKHHHAQHQIGEKSFWKNRLDKTISLAKDLFKHTGNREKCLSLIREAGL